jgi:predicted DNA-binding mobile mystery protein A
MGNVARKNLDKRFARWQPISEMTSPPRGWVRAIREAIGMTSVQLASRLKVSQPRISKLERDEVSGAITLDTLRRTAQALNCTLVYSLVPNTSLEQMVRNQAQKTVKKHLARVDHTMKLEAQGLSDSDLTAEYEQLINEMIQGNLRGLWANNE